MPAGYVVQPAAPVAAPVTGTQYHAQDEAGHYSFGYNDPNSIRQEVKVDGTVRGAYKYVGQSIVELKYLHVSLSN